MAAADCRKSKGKRTRKNNSRKLLVNEKVERTPTPEREMVRRRTPNRDGDRKMKGIIHPISGGPSVGDSNNSRKRSLRELNQETQRLRGEFSLGSDHVIYFGKADMEGVSFPHSDPLVISIDVAYYVVKRVLVDSGSSANILFLDAFEKMGLKRSMLKPVRTPLQGFGGATIEPLGVVSLVTMLGMRDRKRVETVEYLVVDMPFAYNAILGRPALNLFESVVSPFHLKMKFPTRSGVGEVRGDQRLARSCYLNSLRRTINRA